MEKRESIQKSHFSINNGLKFSVYAGLIMGKC